MQGRASYYSDRLAGRPTASGTDRCTGGMGLPGSLEWGRPDCEQLAAWLRALPGDSWEAIATEFEIIA